MIVLFIRTFVCAGILKSGLIGHGYLVFLNIAFVQEVGMHVYVQFTYVCVCMSLSQTSLAIFCKCFKIQITTTHYSFNFNSI